MSAMETPPLPGPDPQALRALIRSGPQLAAVARLLKGGPLTGVTVERVHFPGAKPVQVQIKAQTADGTSRMLIGEWQGDAAAEMAKAEATRLAKPRRGQGTAVDAAVIVADEVTGLTLRRPGFDTRLPGLRLLHDRDWAKVQLSALGCDPAAGVALVAHRLGKRAVLRIDGPDGTRYARLRPVTSTSGKAAYAAHQALWAAMQDAGAGLAVPCPVAFDQDSGLALFDALPGAPPVFQGIAGFEATCQIMRALHTLQALPLTPEPHKAQDELAILATWAARTAEVFPDLAKRLRTPLARLGDQMAALAELAPVPCHRDLHEGQILLADGCAGLLDFDTLRLGDPALDVGNLQAHLILAELRDGQSRQAFVTAMDNALPHLSLARITLWRRAALLRLAMIYAFSVTPRSVILGLIREAA